MIRYLVRAVAQWYISRAIDCDRPIPGWVMRRLSRDSDLKRFYRHSIQLANRLRGDAGVAASVAIGATVAAPSARSRRATAWSPLATLVLCVFGIMLVAYYAPKSREEALNGSQSVNADQEADLARQRNGQVDSQSIVQADGNLGATLDPEQLRSWLAFDAQRTISPINQIGSRYGEALSQFDQRVAEEQRRVIAEGTSVWNFFVNKLPDSMAALAGR